MGTICAGNLLYRVIDRKSLYKCASMTPDYYWYYFNSGYRAEIEAWYFGTSACQAYDVCRTRGFPPFDTVPTPDKWYLAALKHWKTIGHKRRYSPNPTCILAPTIYDPISRCTNVRSGCEQTDSRGRARRGFWRTDLLQTFPPPNRTHHGR